MAINKVIYGGEVLIDLTGDTVTPDKLSSGITTHDKSGEPIVGTNTFDVDSGDATAVVAEILESKTVYARGAKITGTMPNRGKADSAITTKTQQVTITNGYHDGSGKVSIASIEQAKIIPSNIRQGVTVLGQLGTLKPSTEVTSQSKTVTPSTNAQTVLPDAGFDYLSQVNVGAIPYSEAGNVAGGTTVTIAG